MDRELRVMVVAMGFCLAGCIGAYQIAGTSTTFFIAVAFIIVACSIVVGIANKGMEEPS